MGFHNHNSAIRFAEVSPYPSEAIPGGMVVENVVVPWLDHPIGTIVSRKSDKPPDPLSWGRVRTLWSFVPAAPASPILECNTIREEIHVRVQDAYRGKFDNRNAPRGTLIASADDDQIEAEVLNWAGLDEEWYESDLGERHSFWQEVLEMCDHVSIQTREWEGGGPGLSGVWYRVRTMDAKALRDEIKQRYEALVELDKEQQAKALHEAELRNAKRKQRRRTK